MRVWESTAQEFFGKYCLDCHSNSNTEGGLNLEQYADLSSARQALDKWYKVRQMLDFLVHDVGGVFDWDSLQEESAAPSLFSSRRIVDLRLPWGKPGSEGSAAIVGLVQAADPDLLLLVSSGEWGTAMRKLKWVATIAQAGVLVEQGSAGQILTSPQHPYTRALLDAVPRVDRA